MTSYARRRSRAYGGPDPPERNSLGWRGRDDGASSVEYALIALFLAVFVALAIGTLGIAVEGLYQQGDDAVESGSNP